ncbi:MAG: M12 family metallo-peptidase [Planctomycetota bacterium]|jgi:hypothetical protein|nr:M12 family metallo-peptidase [Planctomycetota bacterium]MDP6763271.1 M12 family metallo-peptidase [Planctomycetota bacterium]MDP6988568.1 M12 family metallo-peptidase [Planctomycetota bacterium]
MLTVLLSALALLACSLERVRFPLEPRDCASGVLGPELATDAESVAALSELGGVRLTDAPLPDGRRVDLLLRRVPAAGPRTVAVNGKPTASRLEASALSLWSGTVAGESDSEVWLAFSLYGSRGWIRTRGELVHLLAAAPDGDWSRPAAFLVSETALASSGSGPGDFCGADPRTLRDESRAFEAPAGDSLPMGSGVPLLCDMAVETDWQYYSLFGDLAAAETYAVMLFAAAADRFSYQLDVFLRMAYLGLWDTPNDPWVTGDNGGDMCEMLGEFRDAWAGNIPTGAHLAHFVSGASLGGGCAYLDVLCNADYGFAVSGNLGGTMPFPVKQSPYTWDFFVFAHETGHNFGSPHTHSYCPPLDQCSAPGPCHTDQTCTDQGTNMSYCHGCGGGMNNITTMYHPTVAALMRERSESACLPAACDVGVNFCAANPNSTGLAAVIGFSGTTSVSAGDLSLSVWTAPPHQFGLFFYGPERADVPFGDGVLCVGPGNAGLFRFNPPLLTDGFGDLDRPVDFGAPPASAGPGALLPGGAWHFQFWVRDPLGPGGSGFNFSDGLTLLFCP